MITGTLALEIVVGLVLLFVQRPHGLVLSPDSTYYLSVARNVAAHTAFTQFDGAPLVQFPPGLSLLYGALLWLGFTVGPIGLAVNAASLVVTAIAGYALATVVTTRRWAGLVVAGLVGLTPALGVLYTMLWSEPPFIAVVMVTLYVLARAKSRGSLGWVDLTVVVAGAWAAVGLRYIGVALVGAVVIGVWDIERVRGWRRALWYSTSVGAVAGIGTVAVAARNLALGSGPFGPSTVTPTTWASLPDQIVESIGVALTQGINTLVRVPAWVASERLSELVGVIVLAAVVTGGWRGRSRPGVVTVAGYAAIYWLILIYSALHAAVFTFNTRLIAPALPAMAVLAFASARSGDSTSVRRWRGIRTIGAWITIAACGTGVLNVLITDGATLALGAQSPRGMGVEAAPAGLVAAVRALPERSGVVVAFQYAEALYLATGYQPIVGVAHPDLYCPTACTAAAEQRLGLDVRTGLVGYLLTTGPVSRTTRDYLARVGVRVGTGSAGRGYERYRLSARSRTALRRVRR